MLRPTHIAETALYVDDLDRAEQFYIQLFGCVVLRRDERLCALRLADEQVLLLFRRGASVKPTWLPAGTVPGHDGSGPTHVCFGMQVRDVDGWERRLEQLGIFIESRVQWPGGATSLYFRDLEGHAIELATPGLWGKRTGETVDSPPV